jgi:hypothetical protein
MIENPSFVLEEETQSHTALTPSSTCFGKRPAALTLFP